MQLILIRISVYSGRAAKQNLSVHGVISFRNRLHASKSVLDGTRPSTCTEFGQPHGESRMTRPGGRVATNSK